MKYILKDIEIEVTLSEYSNFMNSVNKKKIFTVFNKNKKYTFDIHISFIKRFENGEFLYYHNTIEVKKRYGNVYYNGYYSKLFSYIIDAFMQFIKEVNVEDNDIKYLLKEKNATVTLLDDNGNSLIKYYFTDELNWNKYDKYKDI